MFRKLKYFFIWLMAIAMGMLGGQTNKGLRRFVMPGLVLMSVTLEWNVKYFGLFLFIPILSMGYGENSWLFKILKSDFWTRLIYGIFLSVPFIFLNLNIFFVALILLPISFLIHTGKAFPIGKYEFLVDDLIRYSVLNGLLLIGVNLK